MLNNLQTHTVNVQSPTATKGASGGVSYTYTTTVTNMPCRVIDASATWKVYYGQKNMDITHQVYTNQNPTVRIGYQLIWNGRTLRVVGVTDKGGAGSVMQIDCQEVQGG